MPLRVRRRHRQKPRLRYSPEKIRIERKNHVRVLELVLRVHVAAERHLRRRHRRIAIHRVPLHQLRLRKLRLHLLPLRRQRRRCNRLAQEVNARAVLARLHRLRERLLEVRELAPLPAIQHLFRAVRIVQIQQRRLRHRIRLALRHRVVRVAVHLDRAERVRLHQHRNRARRERKRRRKIHRLAQDQVLGRLHVRKNRLVRLLGAPGQPGERQRSSHHLQEAAPAHRIHPLTRLPRELPLQQLVEPRRLRQIVQVLPETLAALTLQLRPHLGQRQPCRRNRRHHLRGVVRCSLFPVPCLCRLHRWHVSQLVNSFGGRIWYCAVK